MNLKVVQEVVVPKVTAGILEIEGGNVEHQVGYLLIEHQPIF